MITKRPRLYLDEDSMDRRFVAALRARGLDVESALEAGKIAQSDAHHLAYATQEQRVLFSFNVGDFCRIHKKWMEQGRNHAGLLLAHQQGSDLGSRIRQTLTWASSLSPQVMANRVEFLSTWG